MNQNNRTFSTLGGIIAVTLWAFNIAFSKILLTGEDIYISAFLIYFLSGLIFLFFGVLKKRKLKFLAGEHTKITLANYTKIGIFFILNNVFLYLSIGYTTNSGELLIVTMLNYTWPVLIFLIHFLFFNGRLMSIYLFPGVMLAIAGIFIVIIKNTNHSIHVNSFADIRLNYPAYILAALTAISWAIYSNLAAKFKQGNELFFHSCIFLCSGLFFFFAILVKGNISLEHIFSILSNPFFAVVVTGPTTIAYFLWNNGIKYGNRSLITSVSFFLPIFSIIFIKFQHNATVPFNIWIAVLLIISGSVMCYFSEKLANR